MFVTVAVPVGKSRFLSSNSDPAKDKPNRLWTEPVMQTLVAKIRETGLPGYRGHAVDLDRVPDTAVQWISATMGEKPTGEKAVLARGYVHNVNNNREFLRAGAFNTVSPMAMSRTRPEVDEDGVPVTTVEQANWLSLDFVRPNTEGIRGAAVVSMEGAKTTMTLTPEQRKLIAELGLTDLQEFNPKLVSEIAKTSTSQSHAQDNEQVTNLLNRVQELTKETVNLMIKSSYLDQVAGVLGCKTEEITGKLTELKAMQANSAKLACESAISKLGNNPLREVVAKRLKDKSFGSAQEAEEAVASEVATAKEYIALAGGHLGGVNSTGNTGGAGSGVLSAFGQHLVGGN